VKGGEETAAAARPIRVGIVDDHAIVRKSLSDFLRAADAFEVVGQAATGRDAVELARTVPMDVLLLDIDMPGQNGIDAIPHILARENAPAVLMLSAHPAAVYGVSLMAKGAAGYLSKACDPQEIVRAITVVAKGCRYVDHDVGSLLADRAAAPEEELPHRKLTNREFQIFLRFAQGQSSQDAARDLSVSHKTVLCYRVRVMKKMQARTSSELTYYALKHKLIA
jgi:two-component system invasion response regulator UvrY